MDPDLYQTIFSLFSEAKDLDAAGRDAVLQGKDADVVSEVQKLLDQHDQPLLKSPAVDADADTENDDLIGSKIGEYMILGLIGTGGMGRVFKAEHTLMRRKVALKELTWVSPNDTSNNRVRRFFEREIQASSKLSHPNIVAAYDAGHTDGRFWYAMEWVEGVDLSKMLRSKGPMPCAQATECVLQTARGLAYAHDNGIVHRDIKPANLLLTPDGVIKILDLGLAKLTESGDEDEEEQQKSLTKSGHLMGSVHYMSPEHAANSKHADARSDIYSLGVTFYRLLTGELPFRGDTSMEVLIAHREKEFPNLADSLTGTPEGLDAIIRKMTERDPLQRYQTMQDVIVDLEALAMRHGWTMSVPESAAFAAVRDSDAKEQRRTLRLGVVAVSVLVVAVILAVVEAQRWPEIPDLPPVVETSGPGGEVDPTKGAEPSGQTLNPTQPVWQEFENGLRAQALTSGVDIRSPRLMAAHNDRAVAAIAFSPNGAWIATAGGDRCVMVCDVSTGDEVHAFRDLPQPMTSVAFVHNGPLLAAGGGDGLLVIWNTKDWSKVAEFTDHTDAIVAIRPIPNTPALITAGADGTVRVWHVLHKKLVNTSSREGNPDKFYAMDVHPKKHTIIAGDRNGQVFRFANDKAQPPIRASRESIWAVAYEPGTERYATAGSDGLIRLWDGYESETSQIFGPSESNGSIRSIAFRPDGKFLATGYHKKEVALWDMITGERRAVLAGLAGPVNSVTFSPDGKSLAVRHGSRISLWPLDIGASSSTWTHGE